MDTKYSGKECFVDDLRIETLTREIWNELLYVKTKPGAGNILNIYTVISEKEMICAKLKQMPKRPPTSLNSHFHGMSDVKLFFPEKFGKLFNQLFRLEKFPEVEDLPCSQTQEAAH